jgi:hypothetical protein
VRDEIVNRLCRFLIESKARLDSSIPRGDPCQKSRNSWLDI